ILEKNLHRVRQPRDSAETGLLERGEAIYLDRFSARANLHARIETVSCGHTNRNDTSLIRFQVSGVRRGLDFSREALVPVEFSQASPLRHQHWRCPSWTRTKTPRVSRTRVSRSARASMKIGTLSR